MPAASGAVLVVVTPPDFALLNDVARADEVGSLELTPGARMLANVLISLCGVVPFPVGAAASA